MGLSAVGREFSQEIKKLMPSSDALAVKPDLGTLLLLSTMDSQQGIGWLREIKDSKCGLFKHKKELNFSFYVHPLMLLADGHRNNPQVCQCQASTFLSLVLLLFIRVFTIAQSIQTEGLINTQSKMSQAHDPGSASFHCNGQSACSDEDATESGAPEPGLIAGQHIRSPLARAVYFKLKEDEREKSDTHVYWYRVIVSRFSEDLQTKFIQFNQDEGTDEFLQNCQEKSDAIFSQIFYSLARPVLNFFMTQTSINGLLNRGSMYIFSKAQFEELMNYSTYFKGSTLLDLGAGDGMVTAQMSGYFNKTYVTEMSSVMVRRLSSKGYKVLDVDRWSETDIRFDLVSCLNLLDRCDKPMSLLAQIKTVLQPSTGRLLVATVIPFKPYVEFNSKTHEPSELLRITGSNFEEQVQQLVSLFHQAGFLVEKFTRLPYLCEGDLRHSFYVLTDAVFVLKVAENTKLPETVKS
ncbi:methyltransferase-like protein 9 [Plakobranchus ocellatus]|uniref:Methyltransferase-like protein 9 n=1 Tax=Plakobranchus ocellatus TaxID=259542 RepID=A0AAV3YUG9_9GAST|nr:methyltransferase-like protein 9 [Plakobranchus ocellatus]